MTRPDLIHGGDVPFPKPQTVQQAADNALACRAAAREGREIARTYPVLYSDHAREWEDWADMQAENAMYWIEVAKNIREEQDERSKAHAA